MKPDIRGEADRAGAVQSGEHKAQQDLIHVYKHLRGARKETESNPS